MVKWILLSAITVLALPGSLHAKTSRTLFDEDALARIKYKLETYDWARDSGEGNVSNARRLAELSLEELWDYVPPPGQMRAINVSFGNGCPVHGREVFRAGGHYPWILRSDRPFQVECPVGGELYPPEPPEGWNPNSVGEEPASGMPITDRGSGWVDEDGKRYYFSAYWTYWQRWRRDILGGITNLYRAYLVTDDPVYARACAVLLTRFAGHYPDMDYGTQAYHSGRFGVAGRLSDRIWENSTISVMSHAYDAIFPIFARDAELEAFLRGRGVEDARRHIEQNMLRVMAQDVMRGFIRGNVGMYQRSLALVAIVFDNDDPQAGPTTEQMRDWIMTGGGNTEYLLWNDFFRDGHGGESSPGYSAGWNNNYYLIADLLPRLGVDIWSNPRLLKMADIALDMAVTGVFTPSIGDTGSIFGARRIGWSAARQGRAFTHYRDPRHAAALEMIGATAESLWTDFFDEQELEAFLEEHQPGLEFKTRNLGGFGLAILEAGGEPHRRGVSMYYGYAGGGHGHRDRLTLEMFAHGRPMLTEMGYPAHWGEKATYWTNNTISHYCVVVDQRRQQTMNRGYLNTLASAPGVQLMDAAAAEATYPGITSMYRRTAALVDISPERSYLLDLFRVRGGNQHDYSFHGPPFPDFATSGTETVSVQEQGTLMGEDVEFGGRPTTRSRAAQGALQLLLPQAEPLVGDNSDYRVMAAEGWCSYTGNAILTRKEGAQVRLALEDVREIGPGAVKLLLRVHNYQRGRSGVTFELGGASAAFSWEEDGGAVGSQWLEQVVRLDRPVEEVVITAREIGTMVLLQDAWLTSDMAVTPHQVGDIRTSGFQYLFDVRRKRAEGSWSATWRDPREDLALTMTVPAGSVQEIIACRAEAELKPNHPQTIDYVLGRNVRPTGVPALASDFIVVAEPHQGPAALRDVVRLQAAGEAPDAVGLLVQLDDHTDLVHSSPDPALECAWEGAEMPFAATAEFALATVTEGEVTRAVLVNGTRLVCGDVALDVEPSPSGRVEAVDFDANTITIDTALAYPEAFLDQVIILGSEQNQTSYTITDVTVEGDRTILHFGTTLFLVQMGRVTGTDAGTSTVVLDKLGRVDGGQHQGRWLYNEDRTIGLKITDCRGSRFTVDAQGHDLDLVFEDVSGDGRRRFWISDIGPGDWYRIPAVTSVERRGPHVYSVRTMTAATITVPEGRAGRD